MFANLNLSNNQILLIVLIIVIVTYYIFGSYFKSWLFKSSNESINHSKSTLKSTPESSTDSSDTLNHPSPFVLYNFYSPKCGWCEKFWPQWEIIKSQINSNTKSNSITAIDIDSSDPQNERLTFYYNISAYPTLILVTPNKNIEYVGDRSSTDVLNFVSKYVKI